MTSSVVTPVAGQWTLLASGPGTIDIKSRSTGVLKLREDTTLPVGAPDDSSNFWPLADGQSKVVKLAAGENVYAWPSKAGMYIAIDPFSTENHLGSVGGHIGRVSANFNKPAGTTAYALGNMIANSASAGSVVPMSFAVARNSGKGAVVRRAKLRKSGLTAGDFRLHLFAVAPTVDAASGDHLAFKTNGAANYLGFIDFATADMPTILTDGIVGFGAVGIGSEIVAVTDTIFGLLEARGANTTITNETFEVSLELIQN